VRGASSAADFDATYVFLRRCSEDPWVPIGATAVVAVLGRGLHAMYKGDSKTSYRMMRYRILFQGSIVLALLYGTYLNATGGAVPGGPKRSAVDKRFYLDTAEEYAAEARRAGPGAAPLTDASEQQR